MGASPLELISGRPIVKICGLRRPEDVQAAGTAGAELIGLVFAPSRRQLAPEEARQLLASTPGHPPAVGVFVNLPPAEINAIAARVGLAAVQLSGQEAPEEAARLEVPYIKVLHLTPDLPPTQALHIMKGYPDAVAFLLDSPSPRGGGSGIAADWGVAAAIILSADRPALLAGGLSPDNVADALRVTGAHGVDVSSGVEHEGSKSRQLIEQFVRAARSAGTAQAPAAN